MRKFIFLLLLLLPLQAFSQGWPELPATKPGLTVVTHKATLCGHNMRSFTVGYDRDLRVALWVAYPLNAALIGEGSRGEGWHPSELLPEKDQAILYKGFFYGSNYDRGHQIPSADRLDPQANDQTFTFINATPQLHDFNGGIWAELEKVVRTWAKRSDTLYVVTGIIPGEETINDNKGNPVNIPSTYWKAVLRRNTDKTGRVHWSSCAVLLPHRVFNKGTWQENLAFFREQAVTIGNLEGLLGYRLFKDSENVDRQANPAREAWWWK